jgi:hypothetical protein
MAYVLSQAKGKNVESYFTIVLTSVSGVNHRERILEFFEFVYACYCGMK